MIELLRFLFPYHKFNSSARLLLLALFFYGLISSPWVIYLNFYILSLGYDKDFVGLVNGLPYLVTMVLGIPLALFSDRIGRRRAMILGMSLLLTAGCFLVLFHAALPIILMDILFGIGNTLFYISQAPYMMNIAEGESRSALFGANFGLITVAGALGSLISGYLPAWFGIFLNIPENSVTVYRTVLLVPLVFGLCILIPLFLMKNEAVMYDQKSRAIPLNVLTRKDTLKFFLPYMMLGLGAGFLIPFINIFFVEKFSISNTTLGMIFGVQQLLGGLGSMISPQIARFFGSKIRMLSTTVGTSLVFLLLFGFSPALEWSMVGHFIRFTLVFMVAPLYLSFAMENFHVSEQGIVNSGLEIVFRLGWAVAPYISGLLQIRYGFSPIILLATLFYGGYAGFSWLLFRDREKKMHNGLAQL